MQRWQAQENVTCRCPLSHTYLAPRSNMPLNDQSGLCSVPSHPLPVSEGQQEMPAPGFLQTLDGQHPVA
jgi:hypothetical protein